MDKNIFNVNGYYLDNEQIKAVTCNSKYLLINAGAGSGKTMTILGKINYLIKIKHINPQNILCISFTQEATTSLKNKLLKYFNYDIDTFTFHKLSLNIIRSYHQNILIANPNLLNYIIREFINYNLINKTSISKFIKKYLLKNHLDNLIKLIETFINLHKANAKTYKDFNTYFRFNYSYTNHQILKIILIIYNLYQIELKSTNSYDFNDMINYATQLIAKNYKYKRYDYIIIDEYQDTSLQRFKLIKAILNQTNANLMVVGDDFQSIYRFTGCDLKLFLDFSKFFPNHQIMSITNTYRNAQELINIAGNFIMQNPEQIKKKLKSSISIPKPLKLVYTSNFSNSLEKILDSIDNKEILILGRNNNDIKEILNSNFIVHKDILLYKKKPNLIIKYLTVHRAKGLESDIVIIINLSNNINGFPTQIPNIKILKLVNELESNYPYDEERRLFYVALTRTKTINYLLVNKKVESIFIKELKRHYIDNIEIIKM